MNVLSFVIPSSSRGFGLLPYASGAHTGRTLMLRELTSLLQASEIKSDRTSLRRFIIEDNVLLKSTASSRKEAFQRLAALYALDPGVLVWYVLRHLWQSGETDRPLLALLCALGRDSLLRATASAVVEQSVGGNITPQALEAAVRQAFPCRYSPLVLASVGRNTISSWTQAGFLESRRAEGKEQKRRVQPQVGVAATTYALLLGYLCGARGALLFETAFTAVLGCPPASLDALAFAASQRGWLDYRRMGDVADVGFDHWLTPGEDTHGEP